MGCVESKEGLSDVDEELVRGPKETATPSQGKGRKKKKNSIPRKSLDQKKELDVETGGVKTRSESTKITVIWRRLSTFSSTQDSSKSNKSLEGEGAGPSGKVAQSSQPSTFNG